MPGTGPYTRSQALERLVGFFETLSPAALDRLDGIYAELAQFRDPFNDVQGLPAIRAIFADMYERTHEPRFVITGTVEQGREAFVRWDFHFGLGGRKRRTLRVQGCSHLVFDSQGRVELHRDYWDAAGELYEQLPLLGALMRALRQRLRA